MTAHQQTLLALLERHLPADDRERGHLDHLTAFVRAEPACFERKTLPGHLTGSAFVLDADRRLLLLHHHRKLDRWLQLGGHDAGERDAAATALREAREESGLTSLEPAPGLELLDVDVHHIPARQDEPAHAHLDVRFLFLADSTAAMKLDASESKALAWVPLPEAETRMGEAGSSRVIAKIERWLASR